LETISDTSPSRDLYFEVKNLVLWSRSEILGFAFANKAALNPKHEIRNSKQYKMPKIQMTKTTEL